MCDGLWTPQVLGPSWASFLEVDPEGSRTRIAVTATATPMT